jgi:hypothetical protein
LRKSFLLRIDPNVFEALRRWADDEQRSVNGHVEFLLRRALSDAGRLPEQQSPAKTSTTTKSPARRAKSRGVERT